MSSTQGSEKVEAVTVVVATATEHATRMFCWFLVLGIGIGLFWNSVAGWEDPARNQTWGTIGLGITLGALAAVITYSINGVLPTNRILFITKEDAIRMAVNGVQIDVDDDEQEEDDNDDDANWRMIKRKDGTIVRAKVSLPAASPTPGGGVSRGRDNRAPGLVRSTVGNGGVGEA